MLQPQLTDRLPNKESCKLSWAFYGRRCNCCIHPALFLYDRGFSRLGTLIESSLHPSESICARINESNNMKWHKAPVILELWKWDVKVREILLISSSTLPGFGRANGRAIANSRTYTFLSFPAWKWLLFFISHSNSLHPHCKRVWGLTKSRVVCVGL